MQSNYFFSLMQIDEEKECKITALKAQIQRLEWQLATSKIVSQPPQAEQPGQSPQPSVPRSSSQSPAPGSSSQLLASKSSSQRMKPSSIVLKLSQPRMPEPLQLSSKDVNKNYSINV